MAARRPGQGRTEKKLIRVPGLINEGGAGTAYHYSAIHRCFSSLYIFLWGKRGKLLFHLLCHNIVFLKEMVSRGGYYFERPIKLTQWHFFSGNVSLSS
jgi:hypothetical protein